MKKTLFIFLVFISFGLLANAWYLPAIIDDKYHGIVISGSFVTATNENHFGGRILFSSTTGDYLEFDIIGKDLQVFTRTLNDGGYCDIYLNDRLIGQIDTYSPLPGQFQFNNQTFRFPYGKHKIRIQVSGLKYWESSGYVCRFDYLRYDDRKGFIYPIYIAPDVDALFELPLGYQIAIGLFLAALIFWSVSWSSSVFFLIFYYFLIQWQLQNDIALLALYLAVLGGYYAYARSMGLIDKRIV